MNRVECSASKSCALGSAVDSCALHILLGFKPDVYEIDGRPYHPHILVHPEGPVEARVDAAVSGITPITPTTLRSIHSSATSGSSEDETSTRVVDTGYLTSNVTSSTVQRLQVLVGCHDHEQHDTTTTTTPNASDTLLEARMTRRIFDRARLKRTLETGNTLKDGSTVMGTGSNGEMIPTTKSGGTIETTTTGSVDHHDWVWWLDLDNNDWIRSYDDDGDDWIW
ncbi:hypothetical protein GN958_ATG14843 [Phytophthora infestans]|uniref:Uncharacterized protein n=1 Tax=Phytophthora infestans TaxID=4787 RepID=A0A8S9UCD2_PHYIN|nr:hypothetical protein GN958_ATG14843 [Phytophthora infestans]